MNPIAPSTARHRLAKIAQAEIGTVEQGGNNRGKRVREYQEATWLKPDAWPWCAAFVAWCVSQWLGDEEVLAALNLTEPRAEKWRPQTAGAFDLERWARGRGLDVLDENAEVRAGDIVIFDFSHCGIITEDAHAKSRTLRTVEGNTNGQGERDSAKGDGVWSKLRDRHLAKCIIRLI